MRCQWFLLCENEAIGMSKVPWGEEPVCARCAARFELEVREFEDPRVRQPDIRYYDRP